MRVEDIMTKRIVTVGFEDTLSTVKEIFDTVKFHHLLVVEDGELQGIVSDRDLLQGQSDLYFFGDGLHTLDSASSFFGRLFLRIVFDVTVQGHDARVCCDADMPSVHTRLPFQFGEHGLLKLTILRHDFLRDLGEKRARAAFAGHFDAHRSPSPF